MHRTIRALALVAVLSTALFATGTSMAATTTVPIPLTTFNPGTFTFGPAAMSTTTDSITLTIDRTAGTRSLNSLTASTTVDIKIQVSFDGGATFPYSCDLLAQGGFTPDDQGNQELTTYEQCNEIGTEGSTNRMARAVLVVAGARVSLSGSLTYN